MIIVPSSAVETMGLGALGGLTAFGRDAMQSGAAASAGGKPPQSEAAGSSAQSE